MDLKNRTPMRGKFWLPETPDHAVDGEFMFADEDHGILRLFDVIDTSVSEAEYINRHLEHMQHSMIIGCYENREYVGLLDTHFHYLSFGECFEYSADVVLVAGNHVLRSMDDISYIGISFTLDNLHHYLGSYHSGIKLTHNPLCVSCNYSTLENRFKITDSLTCTICYTFNLNHDARLNSVKLESVTRIELESDSCLSLKEWLRLIEEKITSYFSIIIGKYLCPSDILAIRIAQGRKYCDKVYYRYFDKHSDLSNNKENGLKIMESQLADYLSEYYSFTEKYYLVISNYLIIHRFDVILEYMFLTAIYALEAFSRYVRPNHIYMPDSEFKEKYLKPLKEHLDIAYSDDPNHEYLNRLKTSLEYTNEHSLRSVLKELFREHASLLKQMFKEDFNALIARIIDTRNWYTHFSPTLQKNAAQDYELHDLFIVVCVLYEICLFKELKMSDEHIIRTIKATYLID